MLCMFQPNLFRNYGTPFSQKKETVKRYPFATKINEWLKFRLSIRAFWRDF